MTHRVILDCDNTMGIPYREVDDGLTLLYLLGRPDIEVVGITTTFGNGTIDEVHPITEALLEEMGREDIPLHKGAGEADEAPTAAAHFLAETVADHPGEISVLAIGPVGNLRGAAKVNDQFFQQVKEIALMGGVSPDPDDWRARGGRAQFGVGATSGLRRLERGVPGDGDECPHLSPGALPGGAFVAAGPLACRHAPDPAPVA